MKRIWFGIMIIGVAFLLSALGADAQVNAGDADDSGLVDNHDILYIGYAFGTTGPRRPASDTQSDTTAPVSLYWSESFPAGPNYTFADADGNGLIDWADFVEVYNHYGIRYHDLRTSSYPTGDPRFNPALELLPPDTSALLTERSSMRIPLYLGAALRPVNEFQGLAFSIRYDSTYIRELKLEIDSTSWLADGNSVFPFQNRPPGRESILDVALTRLGPDPVSGFGYIGMLSIIIEDDLIDFKPFEKDSIHTYIHLGDIHLRDVEFNQIPVASRPLKLTIVNPKLVSSTDPEPAARLAVYPNPMDDWLRLECSAPISRLEIWDVSGRLLFRQAQGRRHSIHCLLPELPPGLLILKAFTDEGLLVEKLFHLPDPGNQ